MRYAKKVVDKMKKNWETNIYLSRFLARYIIGSEDTKKKYFVPKKIGTLLCAPKVRTFHYSIKKKKDAVQD